MTQQVEYRHQEPRYRNHAPVLTTDSGTDAAWCAECAERLLIIRHGRYQIERDENDSSSWQVYSRKHADVILNRVSKPVAKREVAQMLEQDAIEELGTRALVAAEEHEDFAAMPEEPDYLKDDPDALAIEHEQTRGGHYSYDRTNCPACHEHSPEVDPDGSGFTVCRTCPDLEPGNVRIICDCGKGEFCPQYGDEFAVERAARQFGVSPDDAERIRRTVRGDIDAAHRAIARARDMTAWPNPFERES